MVQWGPQIPSVKSVRSSNVEVGHPVVGDVHGEVAKPQDVQAAVEAEVLHQRVRGHGASVVHAAVEAEVLHQGVHEHGVLVVEADGMLEAATVLAVWFVQGETILARRVVVVRQGVERESESFPKTPGLLRIAAASYQFWPQCRSWCSRGGHLEARGASRHPADFFSHPGGPILLDRHVVVHAPCYHNSFCLP